MSRPLERTLRTLIALRQADVDRGSVELSRRRKDADRLHGRWQDCRQRHDDAAQRARARISEGALLSVTTQRHWAGYLSMTGQGLRQAQEELGEARRLAAESLTALQGAEQRREAMQRLNDALAARRREAAGREESAHLDEHWLLGLGRRSDED